MRIYRSSIQITKFNLCQYQQTATSLNLMLTKG